jgi:F-type H+-transporting ATPase subunit gamma
MSSLKALRIRIKSVQSTQKITTAMKMVASAKFKRALHEIEQSEPYTEKFLNMTKRAATHTQDLDALPRLLGGTTKGIALIIGMASSKGLCGAYNANVAKEILVLSKKLKDEGKKIALFPIGKRIKDVLIQSNQCEGLPSAMAHVFEASTNGTLDLDTLVRTVVEAVENGTVGSVYVVTGNFQSVMSQPIQSTQLVPLPLEDIPHYSNKETLFEPNVNRILPEILSQNFKNQLKFLYIENKTCEHAARMTAMDNASRNAREMLKKLQLVYNQGRQANITNELIEIITGANAS